jgi:RNA polymerase sigma-32 factor
MSTNSQLSTNMVSPATSPKFASFQRWHRTRSSCWRSAGRSTATRRQPRDSSRRTCASLPKWPWAIALPLGEVISEDNVGLMQAVRRFDPDKGFRLATYVMWWIRASVHEYVLRSWSLVKTGPTAAQKKLFFNLRRAKSQIRALDEALHPDQVKTIANRFGLPNRT